MCSTSNILISNAANKFSKQLGCSRGWAFRSTLLFCAKLKVASLKKQQQKTTQFLQDDTFIIPYVGHVPLNLSY